MRTSNFIFALAALLALASTASAQEQIKKQFEKISNYNGVARISAENATKVDTAGVTNECRVVVLKIGHQYFGDCEQLRKAFEKESNHASMFYSYMMDHFADGENAAQRKRWSVTREGNQPVIVGDMKNSSYLIANFDDPEHPGYRACYAAEWTETDDPDPRPLQLTYVYGRKPTPQTSISRTIRISGMANIPDDIRESLEGMRIIPDSLLDDDVFHYDLSGKLASLRDSLRSAGVYKFDYTLPNRQPQDIPMKSGNTREWMQQAVTRVKHLSASDWHRFFGIMTQKMMDNGKKESTEDMLVAANLVLDLCKNADQLDADERALAARRLQQMNKSEIIPDPYVRDLLQLGYKKLLNK